METSNFACGLAVLAVAMASCSGSGSGPGSPLIQETSAAWPQPPNPTGDSYVGPSLRVDFPEDSDVGAAVRDLTSGWLFCSLGGRFASVDPLGFAGTAAGFARPGQTWDVFETVRLPSSQAVPRFALVQPEGIAYVMPLAPNFGMLDPDLSRPVECKEFDTHVPFIYTMEGFNGCLVWTIHIREVLTHDLIILSETGEVIHSSGGWPEMVRPQEILADGSFFLGGTNLGKIARISPDGTLIYAKDIDVGVHVDSFDVLNDGATLSFAGRSGTRADVVFFGSIDKLSGSVDTSALSFSQTLWYSNLTKIASESPTFVFNWKVDSNGDSLAYSASDDALADARGRALIVRPIDGETYLLEVGDSSSSTSFVGEITPRGPSAIGANDIEWNCSSYPDAAFIGPTWNAGEVVQTRFLAGLDGSMILPPMQDLSYGAFVSGGQLIIKNRTALPWGSGSVPGGYYPMRWEFSFIQGGTSLWNQQMEFVSISGDDYPIYKSSFGLPNGNTGFVFNQYPYGAVLVSVDPASGIQSAVEMRDEASGYRWNAPNLPLGSRNFYRATSSANNLGWPLLGDVVEVLADGDCPENCLTANPWLWEGGGDVPPVYSNLQITQIRDPLPSAVSPVTFSSFELTSCQAGFRNVSIARTSTSFTSVPLCP